MRARLVPCLLSIVPALCSAQGGDPLQAPACRSALQRLEAARAASAPDRGTLQRLQDAAARACLNARPDLPAVPGRMASPPPAPLPRIQLPAPARPAAPLPAVPPPVTRPPAPDVQVLRCDASQCWASDGSVLQRSGQNLLGPRGVCTQQAGQLHCP